MKTAKELELIGIRADVIAVKAGGQIDADSVFIDADFVGAIQADAREQGRIEGLEEAAKVCAEFDDKCVEAAKKDPFTPWVAIDRGTGARGCADAIRKLAEKSGPGDG